MNSLRKLLLAMLLAAVSLGGAGLSATASSPVAALPLAGGNGAAENWKFSFELAFGESSPYSKRYPDLYSLPYRTDLAITREVLDRVIPIALAESGTRRRGLLYGPGGYAQFPVVPSAQLDVAGSPAAIETLRDCLAYLLQQTDVLASRPLPGGRVAAIQITERRGHKLAVPAVVDTFWKRLRRRAPHLQGFLPVRVNGSAGLRCLDTAGTWTVRDVVGFDAAIEAAAAESGLTLQSCRFMAQTASGGNDWKVAPDGAGYLRRFDRRGQTALRQRLITRYAPRVDGWIRAAFGKYTPGRVKLRRAAPKIAAPAAPGPIMAATVPGF